MYQAGRFFTVTGREYVKSWPLSDCTGRVQAMHAKYLGADPSTAWASPRVDNACTPDAGGKAAAPVTDDGEILEIARKSRSGERLEAFLAGDWQRLQIGDGSQLAADQAFCNLLAFWLNRDPARIDAVFRRSGMMRPKWDERRGARTYGEITIGRAVRDCREVYEQRRRRSALAAALPGRGSSGRGNAAGRRLPGKKRGG